MQGSIKMTDLLLQKQAIVRYCYQELSDAPCFFPFHFISKDAVFHGLSGSGFNFLGHRDQNAFSTKIQKKISVKNLQKFLYFEFFITKMDLYWEGLL